jgi:iron(II)-dependent oxidoreductase
MVLCHNCCFAQETPRVKSIEKDVTFGMVYVPAGDFIMGMSGDDAFKECQKFYQEECKEEPAHNVYLDAFYIDRCEVSQGEYDKSVTAGKCKANVKTEGFADACQPVIGVTWDNAKNYCLWAGKRLPKKSE